MNNKYYISMVFLLLLILPFQCLSLWIVYATFGGQIPSYTYPFNLNTGDTIRGLLSWPGTEDLDIYLY